MIQKDHEELSLAGLALIRESIDSYRKIRSQIIKKSINLNVHKITDYINIDTEILGGSPVFMGTRAPVESLFFHLEKEISIDEFLSDFPSVTKEQAIAVIEIASKILISKNITKLYEIAA